MEDAQPSDTSSLQDSQASNDKILRWSKTIIVRVGPIDQQSDFTVHEHVLRANSPFFEAALGRGWTESQERLVKLLECTPQVFEIYTQWIYRHRVGIAKEGPKIRLLVAASILGDVLQDGHFQDKINNELARYILQNNIYLRKWFTFNYANTKEDDKLRRLAIDSVVYTNTGMDWVKGGREKKDVPHEVLWDIVTRCREAGSKLDRSNAPFAKHRCHYHIHQDGVCYKTKYR
ncbi:hypothetical protein BLS_010010 [Venturia inaequalis]|uniref:BTB domain-containing protein n=1 Tax=Venturia inaequalis TaxID=5025 RepID=A0A8H3U406_VENIN|nr:hypothetical protein BLS_010010 [Venturia inaequalis]